MKQIFNLTARERAVLSVVEFEPTLSAMKIAQLVRSTGSAVAYTLRTLIEKKIISHRVIIDYNKLGFVNFAIFFCLEVGTIAQHKKLLAFLSSHTQVAWLGSLTGEYQYGLAFFARSIHDVHSLLLTASEKYGVAFAHKTIVPRVSMTLYPRSYLDSKIAKRSGVLIKSDSDHITLSESDHVILRALANGSYGSLRDIARLTGYTPSKVERHLKTLEKDGVIAKRILAINSEALGVHSFRLLLQLNHISVATKVALQNFCNKSHQVVLFTESLGEWDYELDVEVSAPAEVATITRQLYEVCGGDLRRIQTLSELEDIKFSLYPF